jgi:hypothetical protein
LGPDALREDSYLMFSNANGYLLEHSTTADAPGYLAELDSRNVRGEEFRPRSPWDEKFLGRDVSSLDVRESALAGVRVALRRMADFAHVDLGSGYLPALVTAELFVEEEGERPVAFAVSLNGRIEAIAVAYARSAQSDWVRAMLPESSFVDGENRLRLLGILDTPTGVVLAPIDGGVAP